MPGPRAIAGKFGEDSLASDRVNMAFDSNYNLNKIGVVTALDGETIATAPHGLDYAPKGFSLIEFDTGKYGHIGGLTVDNDYLYLGGFGTGVDEVAFVTIEPLATGFYKKDMTGRPVLLVGDGRSGDHNYKLHSGYDTLKVYTTGTLTIEAGLYDPGTSGGTQTLSATFNHNLGYVPLIGPFVSYETIWEAYRLALSSFYDRGSWTTSTSYYTGDLVDTDADTIVDYKCIDSHTSASATEPGVGASWTDVWEVYVPENTWTTSTSYVVGDPVVGTDRSAYRCISTHTSSSSSEPGVGASWATYWELDSYGHGIKNVYVNNLEDDKFSGLGGFEPANYATIRFYATSTQVVLELERVCTAEESIPTVPPIIISEYEPYHSMTITVDYTIFYNKVDEELNLLTG